MAKIVFDKCISQERLTDTEHDSYYFKVHYNYEFLEDFRDLFKDGGPRVSPEAGTNGASVTVAFPLCCGYTAIGVYKL